MIFNTRDTVIIGKIEYICYGEQGSERFGILIQDYLSDMTIKNIINYIENENTYKYRGIEIKDSEAYILFTKKVFA